MGINKVIYYGEVLVDMSQVTVTPETLGKGATALDAKGDLITGTHECKETEPKLQSKTVTPTTSLQTVNPDSGYDGLSKVTVNAMPTATQATPSISVSSAGKITATATQTAGYVAAGTKTGTKQLTTQAAQTITPGTTNKTIASGRYLTGTQTIKGDSNLVAGNIKSGVSIFGVAGNYEGSGGGGGGTIVTGEISVLEGYKSNGTTIATVSGLGFKPKNVFIVAVIGSSTVTSTSCYIWCGLRSIDGIHQNVFAKKNNSNVRVYCQSSYVKIIINDDGFSLESTNGSAYTTSKYMYLATSE